jgi:hypothetical protein
MIEGRYRVESDIEGSFYRIRFAPSIEQIWSAQPKGLTVSLGTKIEDVEAIIGEHHEPNLRDARLLGWAEFRGEMSRDDYARFAKF